MLQQTSNEASEQVEKQTQTWGNVVKSFESRVESLYLTIYNQISETAKGSKKELTDMVQDLDKWVEETGIAKKALDAFVEGLLTGLDFEIPEGGLKEWLDSLDLEDITDQFKSFGQGVSGVVNVITGLATAVPWELLASHLDTIAKAAFWSFIIGRGASTVQSLLQIGVAMRDMARHTAEAFATTTSATVVNTAAMTANTAAQNLALTAAQAQAQALRQAAVAKEAAQKAAIANAEAERLATQAQTLEGYRFVDALNAQTLALDANRTATAANTLAKQAAALAEAANANAARAAQEAFAAEHGTIKSNLKGVRESASGLSKIAQGLRTRLMDLATNPMVWVFTIGPALYEIGTKIYNHIQRPLIKAKENAQKTEQAIRSLKSAMDKIQKGETLSDEDYKGLNVQHLEFLQREKERYEIRQWEAKQYKFLIKKIGESENNLMRAQDEDTFGAAKKDLEYYLKASQEFAEEMKKTGQSAEALEMRIEIGMKALEKAPQILEIIQNPKPIAVNFDQNDEALRKAAEDTRASLASAVRMGLSDKEAYELWQKSMEESIEEQGKTLEEKLAQNFGNTDAAKKQAKAYAEAWMSSAKRRYGLDEESKEVAKLNEEMRASLSSIAQYAEYLKRTGNSSEYAANRLQKMTDALIDQKFEALDAVQQQKVIDELEKMGKQAGGKYAKALVERIKGGTKNAAQDALAAIKPVSDDDITNAIEKASEKAGKQEEQAKKTQEALRNLPTSEYTGLAINGKERRILTSDARDIIKGNANKLKYYTDYYTSLDKMEAEAEAKRKAKEKEYWTERNRYLKEVGRPLEGPKEYQQEEQTRPEDAVGQAKALMKALTGSGVEAAARVRGEFEEAFTAAPLALPAIQLPAIDTSAMLQDFQTKMPQLFQTFTQTFTQSFSGLQLTFPPEALDGFFNGIVERVNTGAETVSLALSTAFSAMDLAPAGVTVAESFTGGLLSGIESSGFVSRLYEKIMAKFSEDITAAGGAK
jgi:hypothetical protein